MPPRQTPRPTKIALTASQIASLDLLIRKKQAAGSRPGANYDYADDVADNLGNVAANATVAAVAAGAAGATPVAAITAGIGAVAAVGAVVTRAIGSDMMANEKAVRQHLNDAARKMPLDQLIQIRNMAMLKK